MHITFMVFGSQNFEKFLQVFQYDQLIIHMLWSRMIELIWSLMSKYVSKGQLLSQRAAKKPEEILDINVCNKSNCKKPPLVDFGTRAKMEFAGTLQTNSKKMKFEKECLQFYQVSVQYLLDQLPLKSKIIKQAQYLHPARRRDIASTSALFNTDLSIAKVGITFNCSILYHKKCFCCFLMAETLIMFHS